MLKKTSLVRVGLHTHSTSSICFSGQMSSRRYFFVIADRHSLGVLAYLGSDDDREQGRRFAGSEAGLAY